MEGPARRVVRDVDAFLNRNKTARNDTGRCDIWHILHSPFGILGFYQNYLADTNVNEINTHMGVAVCQIRVITGSPFLGDELWRSRST